MGKLYNFLLGLAVGFGLYHAMSHYSVVHADDGLHLVPKQSARMSDIYVNVSDFKPVDWRSHPELVVDLMTAGKDEIIKGAAVDAVNDAVGRGLEKILPAAPPAQD
ncbi:hypothetical protein [Aeoliella sp.]|uniref:hypothetical protein n=1 Tax=Aeoliella sp. TaxID=2795800 RepID=UPI003CCB970A